MPSWPFDRQGALTDPDFGADDPAICAHQVECLKTLLASFDGRPEESLMILNRLEITYLGAGLPEEADATRRQARIMAARCGYAAVEAWERSPRTFRKLLSPLRHRLQLGYTRARYRAGAKVVDKALTELQGRAPWNEPAAP